VTPSNQKFQWPIMPTKLLLLFFLFLFEVLGFELRTSGLLDSSSPT
jgi:hypothetical protein